MKTVDQAKPLKADWIQIYFMNAIRKLLSLFLQLIEYNKCKWVVFVSTGS